MDISSLCHELSVQAQTLLDQLDAFKAHVAAHPRVTRPDIALNRFRADVVREAKQLEHHGGLLTAAKDDAEQRIDGNGTAVHQIRSSNITHLGYIWDEVKRNEGVTAIRKQVRYRVGRPVARFDDIAASRKSNSKARQRSRIYHDRGADAQRGGRVTTVVVRSDKEHVTVDVVADKGAKWIKVFTKNQKWLMMDLAKEGLVDFAPEPKGELEVVDDEHEPLDQSPTSESRSRTSSTDDEMGTEQALGELTLVKMAKEFLLAAKTTRVGQHHRHPEIHFHLPKLERNVSRDVDAVLQYIEKMGTIVLTADQLQNRSLEESDLPITRTEASNLLAIFDCVISPPPVTPLTDTLNIDCTLLIALISDISHLARSAITIPSHYDGRESKKDIEGQIASEEQDALLPNHIYPILRGKKLVCTDKAAAHLRNIVRIMGSESETRRSNILLESGDAADGRDARDVRHDLLCTSVHWFPEDLILPIQVIDLDEYHNGSELNLSDKPTLLDAEVMRRIANQPRLSALNRSVFLHGWRQAMTTVSLNRVVSEWLDRAIDNVLDQMEAGEGWSGDIAVELGFVGPRVLVCGRERSLLGNEKRGNHSRADDDIPV